MTVEFKMRNGGVDPVTGETGLASQRQRNRGIRIAHRPQSVLYVRTKCSTRQTTEGAILDEKEWISKRVEVEESRGEDGWRGAMSEWEVRKKMKGKVASVVDRCMRRQHRRSGKSRRLAQSHSGRRPKGTRASRGKGYLGAIRGWRLSSPKVRFDEKGGKQKNN